MKTIIKLIVIDIFILFCGVIYGQNSYTALKGSDFVKGLENKDNLRGLLLENHFYLSEKGKIGNTVAGHYEYWQSSVYYVDIMATPGKLNQIEVRVHETMTDIPQHIMLDIKRLFPTKSIEEQDEHLAIIDGTIINKETRCYLKYSRNTDNFQVVIWFDYPYYHFRFQENFPD